MWFGSISLYVPRGRRSPRAYAFIKSDTSSETIFVPNFALADLPRRPRIGDRVAFKLQRRGDGMIRAIDVRFTGRP